LAVRPRLHDDAPRIACAEIKTDERKPSAVGSLRPPSPITQKLGVTVEQE
jgi:hypothetical protein